jgi:hypothetical protein
MKFEIVKKHISRIRPGDTVRVGQDLKTVCGKDIKRCPFMGITLFGDSYKLGTKLVEVANIFHCKPKTA